MINKINRIYSIFKEDVVLSDYSRINAIEGYDVKFRFNVLTKKDLASYFYDNNYSMSSIDEKKIWLFENPANEEKWYIGNNIIAWKRKKGSYYEFEKRPKIIALRSGDRVLVSNINTIVEYSKIIGPVKRIALCSSIGYLSTPHSACANDSVHINPVKLPFIV